MKVVRLDASELKSVLGNNTVGTSQVIMLHHAAF